MAKLCDIVNLVRKEQNAPNQPFSSHIQPNSEPYEHIDFCTVVVLGKRQIINPFALEMINGIALYHSNFPKICFWEKPKIEKARNIKGFQTFQVFFPKTKSFLGRVLRVCICFWENFGDFGKGKIYYA